MQMKTWKRKSDCEMLTELKENSRRKNWSATEKFLILLEIFSLVVQKEQSCQFHERDFKRNFELATEKQEE